MTFTCPGERASGKSFTWHCENEDLRAVDSLAREVQPAVIIIQHPWVGLAHHTQPCSSYCTVCSPPSTLPSVLQPGRLSGNTSLILSPCFKKFRDYKEKRTQSLKAAQAWLPEFRHGRKHLPWQHRGDADRRCWDSLASQHSPLWWFE